MLARHEWVKAGMTQLKDDSRFSFHIFKLLIVLYTCIFNIKSINRKESARFTPHSSLTGVVCFASIQAKKILPQSRHLK
jgi:hypothetical protein